MLEIMLAPWETNRRCPSHDLKTASSRITRLKYINILYNMLNILHNFNMAKDKLFIFRVRWVGFLRSWVPTYIIIL